jgi:hypothetical protein
MGAQVSITNQYAKEAGFKGRPTSIQISRSVEAAKKKLRIQYRALLKKIGSSKAELNP